MNFCLVLLTCTPCNAFIVVHSSKVSDDGNGYFDGSAMTTIFLRLNRGFLKPRQQVIDTSRLCFRTSCLEGLLGTLISGLLQSSTFSHLLCFALVSRLLFSGCVPIK